MNTYFVDIDGTLLATQGNDYQHSQPDEKTQRVIDKVNRLFDEGHKIIIWTARGMSTGINWFDFTKKQLKKWGIKYHELHMGKPSYDFIIDDKALTPDEFART